MKVKELIKELEKMPQDADVTHIWDGCSRTNIEHVWICNDGKVATVDFGMTVYKDSDRPKNSPSAIDSPYWESPRNADSDIDI